MDYAQEVASLKATLHSKKLAFRNIDQYHREIKNELSLKRNQVSQFRKDLDTANSKIFELNRQLEAKNSTLRETEFSLKLALKKAAALEEKLKEISDSHTKMALKEEMRLTEIAVFNSKVQELSHRNHQLSREVDEANDKLKYYDAFQKELEDRQAKINVTITKVKENTEKLEEEYSNIAELGKSLRCADEYKNLCHYFTNNNQKLINKNIELENKIIEIEAQCQKLKDYMKNCRKTSLANFNTKLQFLQWENRCKEYAEKAHINETLITSLSEALQEEIEANAKLLLKNEKFETQIQELEKKIANSHNGETLKKEYEVIEIE